MHDPKVIFRRNRVAHAENSTTYADHLEKMVEYTTDLLQKHALGLLDRTEEADLAWKLHDWWRLDGEARGAGGYLPISIPHAIRLRMSRNASRTAA